MEKEDEWMHYCDGTTTKEIVVTDLKEPELPSRRYPVPYDTTYFNDTLQIGNVIYITGGGVEAAKGSPELFFQTTMKVTITPSKDIEADKLANMNTARAYHSMTSLKGKFLYAIGGTNSTGDIASCEEYSIDANKWREIAPLNEKKKFVSVCGYNSQILYAFGGSTGKPPKVSDKIESLDISAAGAKAWELIKLTAGGELWKPAFFLGSYALSESCILVFGGVTNDNPTDNSFFFNPKTKKLEKHGNLLKPDTFYRTKPGSRTGNLSIVGSTEGDLHIFKLAEGKWDLMYKKFWYPAQTFSLKSDTF